MVLVDFFRASRRSSGAAAADAAYVQSKSYYEKNVFGFISLPELDVGTLWALKINGKKRAQVCIRKA